MTMRPMPSAIACAMNPRPWARPASQSAGARADEEALADRLGRQCRGGLLHQNESGERRRTRRQGEDDVHARSSGLACDRRHRRGPGRLAAAETLSGARGSSRGARGARPRRGRVYPSPLPGRRGTRRRVRVSRQRGPARDGTAARLRLYRKGTPTGTASRAAALPCHPLSSRRVSRASGRPSSRAPSSTPSRRWGSPGVAETIVARIEVSSAYPAADLEATVLAETGAGSGASTPSGSRAATAGSQKHWPPRSVRPPRLATPVGEVAWGPEIGCGPGPGLELWADGAVGSDSGRPNVGDPLRPAPPRGEARRSPRCATGRRRSSMSRCSPLPSPAPSWRCRPASGATRSFVRTGARHRSRPPLAGTPGALERLGLQAGPGAWLEAVASLRPELELDLTSPRRSSPPGRTTRGRRARTPRPRAPLRSTAAELARRVGPLAFAGSTQRASGTHSWKGALRSGLRAAEDLLRRRKAAP